MRNYACWKAEEVAQTVVDDANRDARAVFSAVHLSARILRREIRSRTTEAGTPVTESEVMDELLGQDPYTEGDRILPIVGESGTGKSHLIRWLDANIPQRDDRHVVYIEKRGTSLRQVLIRILDGLEGVPLRHAERFADLRARVEGAAANLEPDSARRRLLYELSLAVREHGTEGAGGDPEERRDLAERLPDLLVDPVFSENFLGDGGVIATNVDCALTGTGEAPQFERVPLRVKDIEGASGVARDVANDLYTREVEELAVAMLNEQLNQALARLVDVERDQIYELMLEVREALMTEGKVLILLVEDFAQLRGVETQLLDAMIADPESQGERVLCPMRSAFAVTSGYFDGKETAMTRIHTRGGYVYSLDAPLDTEGIGVTREYVREFVATYLNAARVGRDGLEAAFTQATAGRDWVPNACDGCEFRQRCHPAFGVARGYGLYPFNEAALDRIVDSRMDRFDPRHILQILERTLTSEREKIVHGEFPDREWAEPYEARGAAGGRDLPVLSAAVRIRFDELDPATSERRQVLVTFWGAVPSEAVNLDRRIMEAFDLEDLPELKTRSGSALPTGIDEETVAKDRRGTPGEVDGPVPPPPPRPKPEDRRNVQLDRWAQGQLLQQGLANELRKALTEAVKGAVEWPAFGVDDRRFTEQLLKNAFSLTNAKGEGTQKEAMVTVEPNSANALFFQALLAARDSGDWTFDGGARRLATLSARADEWADQAVVIAAGRDQSAPVFQLLLLSNVPLGLSAPGDPPARLIASAFDRDPRTESTDQVWADFRGQLTNPASGRSVPRSQLIDVLVGERSLRQGMSGSSASAIDSAPLLDAIQALDDRGWSLPDADELADCDSGVRWYADALRRGFEREIPRRLESLAERRRKALVLLGGERKPRRLAKAIERTLARVGEMGVGSSSQVSAGAELERRFFDADLGIVDRLAPLESLNDVSMRDRLALIADAERSDFAAVHEYLGWADTTLAEASERADAQLSGHGEGDDPMSTLTVRLVETLREVGEALKGLSG
ncbi:MAG TPA: protein DpdH [Solirubrobacterales bacterium]|nr:protein DpdH [Solirubrobacterales bacterium]